MAPGSAIGINYQDQIKSNCRMYLGCDVKIHIITALDAEHSPPWAAYLMQTDARGQDCVLSVKGNTIQEVFTKMHNASARTVQRYIKTNGFQSVEDLRKKAKSRRGKTSPSSYEEEYLHSSSESEDESNVSEASARSTRSSIVSSKSAGPVLTPPTSTGSTTESPERNVASTCPVPVMNPVPASSVPVPPPGWPNRYSMKMHAHPPPPPPPLPLAAARVFQPAPIVPPPLRYPGGSVYPVILTLKSKTYGELMVLDRCSMDYAVIVTRALEILLERFHEFPRAPAVLPSKEQIRLMRREIESVTVNGERYVLGGRYWDLSALPLGPAPKSLSIVLSVGDGGS